MRFIHNAAVSVLTAAVCLLTSGCTLVEITLPASGTDITTPEVSEEQNVMPTEADTGLTDPETEEAPQEKTENELEAVAEKLKNGYNMYVNDYLPSDLEKLQAICKKIGIDLVFGDDGTVTAQISDVELKYGSNWPQNTITEKLPVPEFDNLVASSVSEYAFEALITGATLDEIKNYVGLVREIGFSNEVSLSERTLLGVPVYSCTLTDSEGFTFTINYTASLCTMSVTIPEA